MASHAEMIEEALDESTFGPGSDHDSAQYWANLARKLARALKTEAALVDLARKLVPGIQYRDADELAGAELRWANALTKAEREKED